MLSLQEFARREFVKWLNHLIKGTDSLRAFCRDNDIPFGSLWYRKEGRELPTHEFYLGLQGLFPDVFTDDMYEAMCPSDTLNLFGEREEKPDTSHMEARKEFARLLKAEMERQVMSTVDFAEHCGVGHSSMQQYLDGTHAPRLENYREIQARYPDKFSDELFGRMKGRF